MTDQKILACFRKFACHVSDSEGPGHTAYLLEDPLGLSGEADRFTPEELQFMKEHIIPNHEEVTMPTTVLIKAKRKPSQPAVIIKPHPLNKLHPSQRKPLWAGPGKDGITFSLLSKFLVCRERFRKRVVEGIVEDEGFKHAMEFGSMWHECEESLSGRRPWEPSLIKYTNSLINKYPTDERNILKWSAICKMQFPHYIEYWRKHQDEKSRQPILEEKAFSVPYILPSGRTVILRGKWDAVMLLAAPTKKEPELYKTWMGYWPKAKFGITNQENKTKGDIDEIGILGTVSRNLQTMIYHFALRHVAELLSASSLEENLKQPATCLEFLPGLERGKLITALTQNPITGVLYNVIRRPLSDRFAIKQKKTETEKQFYQRLSDQIDGDAKHYFMRWRVLLTPPDIEGFRQQMFDPILEQLCDWWEWIQCDPFNPWRPRTVRELLMNGQDVNPDDWPDEDTLDSPHSNRIHWQAPWGVYDSLAGGFRGDYFELLTTGREFGLRRIKTLYPELEIPGG